MRERLELLGEAGAFYKLVECCRQAEEAATELGMRLEDGRWARVAMQFQRIRLMITDLRTRRIS